MAVVVGRTKSRIINKLKSKFKDTEVNIEDLILWFKRNHPSLTNEMNIKEIYDLAAKANIQILK